MEVCQIAIDIISERERQMTSNYFSDACDVCSFSNKRVPNRQQFFLRKRTPSEYHNSLCMSYQTNYSKREYFVCFITYMGHLNLWNILFMFHHIHVTFKFRSLVQLSPIRCLVNVYGYHCHAKIGVSNNCDGTKMTLTLLQCLQLDFNINWIVIQQLSWVFGHVIFHSPCSKLNKIHISDAHPWFLILTSSS